MKLLTKSFHLSGTSLALPGIALLMVAIIFVWPLFRQGSREIGVVENIDGIPYPQTNQTITITEKLAHADLYLVEPVLAKTLTLTVTFTPQNANHIALGVREKSFWLGYTPITLYTKDSDSAAVTDPITKTVTIPLTDKFQEPNRSLDLMFFTNNVTVHNYDAGIHDTTSWQLHEVTATVSPTIPTVVQLVDYAASLALRERAI